MENFIRVNLKIKITDKECVYNLKLLVFLQNTDYSFIQTHDCNTVTQIVKITRTISILKYMRHK